MLRHTLSIIAVAALAAAGALVPTAASADTTGSIEVRSEIYVGTPQWAAAEIAYTCFDPSAATATQPLLVTVRQYANGGSSDETAVASDRDDLVATCDGAEHWIEISMVVVSGAFANGPAVASLFIGYGSEGDLGPLHQDVDITGRPKVDPRADVAISVNASPEPVTKGKKITVKGKIIRAGKAYARKKVTLEFKADGDAYERVKNVTANKKGAISTSMKATTSGTFRFTSSETNATKLGVSLGDHVEVQPKPKTYKNCSAPNTVYPHGVARKGVKDEGGTVANFMVDKKTYSKNKKLDADKDGIACERP